MMLHAQGKFAQALDELKLAFSLDPRPELLYAMGQLHVSLGQCSQAITFYQRYLATKPASANAAIEAIKACEPSPAATAADPPGPTAGPPSPPDLPAPPDRLASLPSLPSRPEAQVASPRAWYGDHVADAMVAGGVAAGLASIFEYRSAVQNRDRADAATGYQRYVDLVDRAGSQRSAAIVLGVAGAALAVAGGLHHVLTERRTPPTISIRPSQGGGLVSWAGAFP